MNRWNHWRQIIDAWVTQHHADTYAAAFDSPDADVGTAPPNFANRQQRRDAIRATRKKGHGSHTSTQAV